MPRGHSIDKYDLVRMSHMMLLSPTARRNLGKRGAEQTQHPWHFARPASWQLTGDANYQDCHSPIFSCRIVPRSSLGIIVHFRSIMLISWLDSIPSGLRIIPRRYPGFNHDRQCSVTNIRFLVRRAHAATPAATTRWPVSTNWCQVLSPSLKQPRCKPRCNKCSWCPRIVPWNVTYGGQIRDPCVARERRD